MNFILLTILVLSFTSCGSLMKKKETLIQPTVAFEVTEGIMHPESILYSPKHQVFFATNIFSGNPLETKPVGYLSKIAADGKVLKSKWVTGLHAPKGMVIMGDFLYVTDVKRIVKVNIPKGRITQTFAVKEAKFLNDLAADAQGNIYASDMYADHIYRIHKNKLSVWLKDARIAGTNGLYTDGKEHLFAAKWGTEVDPKTSMAKNPGNLAVVSLKNPTEIVENKNIQGHLDGIGADNKGLWISDWMSGDVYFMNKKGDVKKIYNLGQGTADIAVAKELGLLLVPQMGQNKLIFIKL